MIKMIAFDIDGVLTTGDILIDANGCEYKQYHLTEIDTLNELKSLGYKIVAITGEETPIVQVFQKKINWDAFLTGCKDKANALEMLGKRFNVPQSDVCFIGDGKYDIPAINYAGLGVVPSNAIAEAKEAADIVLPGAGGSNCIYELKCLLKKWNSISDNDNKNTLRLQKNVAFIPARGGSKSIPQKNIMDICGKPMIYWAIRAAQNSAFIKRIVVSTDSIMIQKVVEGLGFDKVRVIGRSHDTATDTATTESAMLEFAENDTDFDNIILIQATSPMLTTNDIDRGFLEYFKEGTDGVLSGIRKKQFLWHDSEIEKGYIVPDYDLLNRPRRQEYNGYIVENGAYYITSREQLLESRCRLSGRIRVCEMEGGSIFEVDKPEDVKYVSSLLRCVNED